MNPRELSNRQSYYLILVPILLSLIFVAPVYLLGAHDINDNCFHIGITRVVTQRILNGENPLDFWLPNYICGYPLFQTYPHIFYIFGGVIGVIFGQTAIPPFVHLIYILCIGLFPLSIFLMLKKMEQSNLVAVIGAWLIPIITSGGYGFELESYLWIFGGLFNQATGMIFAPLAIGYTYSVLKNNRGWIPAYLFSVLALLSHVITGFIVILSVVIMIFTSFKLSDIWKRGLRLIKLFALVGLTTAYFYIPIMINSKYQGFSFFETLPKLESYGHREIITRLINGDILEKGRFPIITLFTICGAFLAFKKRKNSGRYLLIAFLFWFMLYFGKPTWGGLLDTIPIIKMLHFERLVTAVQLMGVSLAAIAIGEMILWLYGKIPWKKAGNFIWIALLIAIVLPGVVNRWNYSTQNFKQAQNSQAGFEKQFPEIEPLLEKLESSTEGRVFSGLRAYWGYNYKIGGVPVYLLLTERGKNPVHGYMPYTQSLANDFQAFLFMLNPYGFMNRLEYHRLFNIEKALLPKNVNLPSFYHVIAQTENYVLCDIESDGYFKLVDVAGVVKADKFTFWKFNHLWLANSMPEKNIYFAIDYGDMSEDYAFPVEINMLNRNEYWIRGDNIRYSIINSPPFAKYSDRKPDSLGYKISEKVDKDTYSCEVVVTKPCFLLFSMNYHPGWHAEVDGEDKEVVMLTPGLSGIELSPGKHNIRLEYSMPWYKWLLLIMGIISFIIVMTVGRKTWWGNK